ncbi:MAG: glycosyltransferase [Gemmatimonadota bacterium]|nr:glycosyltransferase [Gemmatimonadota bacterium]
MDRSRLKVLYISRGYTTHDHRFLKSFVGAGWAPIHLPLLEEKLDVRPLPEGVRTATWTTHRAKAGAPVVWRSRRNRLIELLSDLRPDVIIGGPVQSGAFVAALARAKPLVTVSWGTDLLVDAGVSPRSRFITRYTLDNSAAVFGDCRAVRDAVHRYSSLTDDRIVTFPWGIDLTRFSPCPPALTIRAELGWAGNEVLISTRSWEPVYAVDVLVRAFALVRERHPSARLILLGDGSLERKIRQLISDLGLQAFIHAPGRAPYESLPDYFRSADAYVSAAVSDGTSMSLLEAMACGLPVVVSNSFGNLEWVREGVNGALALPGDIESLSAAMLRVISHPDEAARMRGANISTAQRHANWDANFPGLVKLVERLARLADSDAW